MQCWLRYNCAGLRCSGFQLCSRPAVLLGAEALLPACPPAGASTSPWATCTPCQKGSGLAQQNCLLKACFHNFHPGPLPDPHGTLIFNFKCTSNQKKTRSNNTLMLLGLVTQRKYRVQSCHSRC